MTLARSKVVLVVEDQPLILMAAAMSLEAAGLEVVEALDADQTLMRVDERPDISAVLTDVDMPGAINGLLLAHALRQLRPNLAIVITSGAAQVQPTDVPAGGLFMPKPYNGEHVAALIVQMIGTA